ncbi:MAG TPA: type II toxin-antitoxin system VapC family toxin [Thermoanaerobaculia bacterium]
MKTVYVETSAIVTWLLKEPVREEISAALDMPSRICSSALTRVEAERAINRGIPAGSWTAAEAAGLVALLDELLREWVLAEVHPNVRRRAGRPFPAEPVRTLEAIHLATALEFQTLYPEVSVLTLDRRILANLVPLGLRSAL